MLDIAVRLVTAWLQHELHGVNAIAQTLPRHTLTGPDDDAPPIVSVVCDADSEDVAARLEPPVVPALTLWMDSYAEIEYRGAKRAKEVIVAAAFMTDASAKALPSIRACSYVLRGARLSMDRYNDQSKAKAPGGVNYRELNNVIVIEVRSVVEQRLTTTAKAAKRRTWGFLKISLVVVEELK